MFATCACFLRQVLLIVSALVSTGMTSFRKLGTSRTGSAARTEVGDACNRAAPISATAMGWRIFTQSLLKEFMNGVYVVIHDWYGTTLRPLQFGFQIDPQSMVDRGHNFGRGYRSVLWHSCTFVGDSNHAATFDSSAREDDGPAGGPVVPPTGGIHFGSSSKLAHRHYHRAFQQSPFRQILN